MLRLGEFMSNNDRPAFLASGEPARLIPVLSDGSREGRTTSIFLAALMAVPPFGRLVLGSLGLRLGKLARIQCFTEVTLVDEAAGAKSRPDGLIIVSTGRQEWRALVEAKCGNAALQETQVETYLDLAKRNNIDAVITISNELAALPTHHPLTRIKRHGKGPALYHWSWVYLLTEATLLISQSPKEFDDPEQRYILSEVVRFFRHQSSGVSRFDRMNSEWKDVVAAVQSGSPLSRSSSEVIQTVATWHQGQRNICLQLSRKLGRNVGLRLTKAHADNFEQRLRDDSEQLSNDGQLKFEVDVPGAAAPIEIVADLRRRNVTCSMRLAAPLDKKSTTARLNWLVRQLQKTTADNVYIRTTWPGRAAPTQVTLHRARENPEALQNPNVTTAATSFEVLMIDDFAADFGRNVKFVERMETVVANFYEQIAEHLRTWVPTPPKITQDVLSQPERPIILQADEAMPQAHEDRITREASEVPMPDSQAAPSHNADNNEDRESAANLSVAAALAADPPPGGLNSID